VYPSHLLTIPPPVEPLGRGPGPTASRWSTSWPATPPIPTRARSISRRSGSGAA